MAWIDVPQAPGATRARARARDETRPGYEIRNAASTDEAELLIYDEIDSWWGVSAGDVIRALAGVTSPNLRVRVNSPGGSVFEGLAIANALRAHPSTVTVQVDGLAASIASVIAMAGDRLVMMPNSMLMIHEASGYCMGDATDMQQMADILGKISDNIAGAYAAKAGGSSEEWRGTMRAETWYLPEDAVAAGLADEAVDAKLAEPTPDEPDMHARWDLAVYGYQGPKAPEKPKPGPPPAKAKAEEAAAPIALTINIGDALGEQLAAAVRDAAQAPEPEPAAQVQVVLNGQDVSEHVAGPPAEDAPTDVPAEPVGTGPEGTAPPAPEPPPVIPEPAAANEPEAAVESDPEAEWANAFAQLTTPDPDPWAAAFAQLTTGPASSGATES